MVRSLCGAIFAQALYFVLNIYEFFSKSMNIYAFSDVLLILIKKRLDHGVKRRFFTVKISKNLKELYRI